MLVHLLNTRGNKMSLVNAVRLADEKLVRQYLDEDRTNLQDQEQYHLLLHDLVCSSTSNGNSNHRNIVYMLCNAGLSANNTDHDENTPLHLAVERRGDECNAMMCVALLQCGADLSFTNKHGLSVQHLVNTPHKVPEIIKEAIKKYSPGLWRAVMNDDLMEVRKLINLWCRVDISKNGCTLKELALDRGTEHIIRLIKDIQLPMKLAHSVLASDVFAVKNLCETESQLNTEFRNLGDMGATPLFYAIMQNSVPLVSALVSKGAKVTTTITFEEEDIAIFFAALNKEMDPEIIRVLTPERNDPPTLLSLLYRGRHVLLHCVENNVHPSAVKYILEQGYPELVALRNEQGDCARDVAEKIGRTCYIEIIDQVVYDWYLDNQGDHRKTLALLGYPHLRNAVKDGVRVCEVVSSMETSSEQAKFDTQLHQYQEQIVQLHRAVEAGNLEQTQNLIHYKGPHKHCFHACLAMSLAKGESQPLLIKAVLRRHTELVKYISRTILNQLHAKLDESRDAFHRTALHYAYALQNGKEIVDLLLDYGASEFTMDKNERSPLVFRDLHHLPQMQDLIQYHITNDLRKKEPDPFSVKFRRPGHCGHTKGQYLYCHGKQQPGHHGNHASSPPAEKNLVAAPAPASLSWNLLSYCVIL